MKSRAADGLLQRAQQYERTFVTVDRGVKTMSGWLRYLVRPLARSPRDSTGSRPAGDPSHCRVVFEQVSSFSDRTLASDQGLIE